MAAYTNSGKQLSGRSSNESFRLVSFGRRDSSHTLPHLSRGLLKMQRVRREEKPTGEGGKATRSSSQLSEEKRLLDDLGQIEILGQKKKYLQKINYQKKSEKQNRWEGGGGEGHSLELTTGRRKDTRSGILGQKKKYLQKKKWLDNAILVN